MKFKVLEIAGIRGGSLSFESYVKERKRSCTDKNPFLSSFRLFLKSLGKPEPIYMWSSVLMTLSYF